MIRCPNCNSYKFRFIASDNDKKEVRTGKIICKKCAIKFRIHGGILDFMQNRSKELMNEIEENRNIAKKRKYKNDNWLLTLPLSDNFGNERNPAINRGYLDNFESAIKKVSLKNKKILELGSGTCWTTNLITKAGADAVATDISREKYVGLESADVFMRNNKIYFERVLCSMDDLPFIDKSFDMIVSNAAVHHSPDIKATFREISRLLKKNGIYVQTNEPVCSIFNRSRKIDIAKARENGMDVCDDWNENTYSYNDYKRLLKDNGMRGEFIFPPSFDSLLNDRESLKKLKGYKNRIGILVSFLWSIRLLKKVLIFMFPLSLHLFGGNFILIARKRK